MIANVRLWNPTALPRLIWSAMVAFKSKSVSANEAREAIVERGFFESYEKMLESQAILMLGLHNHR